MIAIKVENVRQSILCSVALVFIFALIAGVTYMCWMQPSDRMSLSASRPLLQAGAPSAEGQAREFDDEASAESSALWFYGTLIVCLILVFGVTFRYYSYREMKEAERRWKISCDDFLARMEMERLAAEEEQAKQRITWLQTLRFGRIDRPWEVNRQGEGAKIVPTS